MADLGDLSKVEEVLKEYRDRKYSERMIRQPDDSAANTNAEEAAKRILEKYGSKK